MQGQQNNDQRPLNNELGYVDDPNQIYGEEHNQMNNQQVAEVGCYEECLICGGNFFGFFRAWCPCICFCCPDPFFQVKTSFAGLIENLGKYKSTLQPGLHRINPWTEKVRLVDMKTRVIDLQQQTVITSDNITIKIDTVVYFRVINPQRAAYKVENLQRSVEEIAYSSLRTICGEHTLQELLEKRVLIADKIESYVDQQVRQWGIFCDNVFIKDMQLNQDIAGQMAAVAKQKKIGESKVISAKADVESAKLLREAADILDSKAAMQIRYLETIQNIGKGVAPKVMFLPLNASMKPRK